MQEGGGKGPAFLPAARGGLPHPPTSSPRSPLRSRGSSVGWRVRGRVRVIAWGSEPDVFWLVRAGDVAAARLLLLRLIRLDVFLDADGRSGLAAFHSCAHHHEGHGHEHRGVALEGAG